MLIYNFVIYILGCRSKTKALNKNLLNLWLIFPLYFNYPGPLTPEQDPLAFRVGQLARPP